MKLTKSLADLDAAADEILAKSCGSPDDLKKSEEEPKGKADDELNAGEVSENVPEEEVESAPETDAPKADEEPASAEEEVKKSMSEDGNGDDIEKCDANGDLTMKKSDEDAADAAEEAAAAEEEKADLEKSIRDTFEGEEVIKKSMDASEFLASVVEVLAKSIAGHSYEVHQQAQQSSLSNDVLAKSLQASLSLNKAMATEIEVLKQQQDDLVKSITSGFEDMKNFVSAQMEEISHQPAGLRKSVSNVSVHERNFQKSLNGAQTGIENLSKSEVLASLNNLMYSGNPLVTANDIISYESGAPLRPEVAQLISSKM